MRYRVNIHTPAGTTVRDQFIEAYTYDHAERIGESLLSDRERAYGYRVTCDAFPKRPANGICTRCGSSRGACGGETDPHE